VTNSTSAHAAGKEAIGELKSSFEKFADRRRFSDDRHQDDR